MTGGCAEAKLRPLAQGPRTTIPSIHEPSALHAGKCSFSPPSKRTREGVQSLTYFSFSKSNVEQKGDGGGGRGRSAKMAPNVTPRRRREKSEKRVVLATVSPSHGVNVLSGPEVIPRDLEERTDVPCAYVHWTVFLRGPGFPGRGVARRARGPRSRLIGGKPPAKPNRKEPRFGRRAPHLDSCDWRAAALPVRPHWVQSVRGEAGLVRSCFPSPAREQWG